MVRSDGSLAHDRTELGRSYRYPVCEVRRTCSSVDLEAASSSMELHH